MEDRCCWNEDLKCFWRAIHVKGKNHIRIDLLSGNCTDMGGAIRLAKAVMPEVTRIDTYAGITESTYYVLGENGKWVSNAPQWHEFRR